MRPSVRRPVAALVVAVAVTTAGVVVPVSMAWSAPRLRFAELRASAAPVPAAPGPTPTVPLRGSRASPAPRLSRVLDAPFALSHLGLRWTGSETATVEVRTAAVAGRWGAWRRVEVSHDLGNAKRREVLSGLVRADGARAVQVRATGDATDVRLDAIDAVNGPRHLVAARALPAGAEPALPTVVTRAEWGADESLRRPTPPSFAPVTRVVVHHTVTTDNDPDPASTMRAMLAYHVKANRWDDIGYNFVIDGAGRIYEGRWARSYAAGEVHDGQSADGRGVVGAHADGENVGSVGVAVMGTFTGTTPSPAAVDALQRLLAWVADSNGIDPLGSTTWASGRVLPTIAGHRDVGVTACPGDRLWAMLPGIRRNVAALVGQARASVTAGYLVLGRDGRVAPFGGADAGVIGAVTPLLGPSAAIASTPSGRGLWVVSDAGLVLPAGDAPLLGSPSLSSLLGPPVRAAAIESTPSGRGYWVAEVGGRVWAFGDAPDLGSAPSGPVVGVARTPSGRGYWIATADGRLFARGDAPDLGSVAGRGGPPVVAVAGAAGGRGYWLVAADGTVYPFGTARRAGGLPDRRIAARVVGARPSSSGRGYYLLGADGAVYSFGDAPFFGAPTGQFAAGAAGLAVP